MSDSRPRPKTPLSYDGHYLSDWSRKFVWFRDRVAHVERMAALRTICLGRGHDPQTPPGWWLGEVVRWMDDQGSMVIGSTT